MKMQYLVRNGFLIMALLTVSGCGWLNNWCASCWRGNVAKEEGEVTAAELLKKMRKHRNLFVINVLDEKEYDDCRIRGSLNLPLEKFERVASKWNKETQMVITYCGSEKCSASKEAYEILKRLGFNSANIGHYKGGMREWYQLHRKDAERYEITGPCEAEYLK